MKRWSLAASAVLLLATGAPAWADSLYVEGPNDNLTSFFRPSLAVGSILTVVVSETNTAESGASTTRRKDSRVRGDWDFGTLLPRVVASGVDVRGRDDFQGDGVTSRNGKLQMDVSATIEEILPNGVMRVIGRKVIRVNDEETEITIRGLVRPMDISTDNRVDSSRLANMQVDFKGTGPASAKATPGILTRLFNWLF